MSFQVQITINVDSQINIKSTSCLEESEVRLERRSCKHQRIDLKLYNDVQKDQRN